MPRAARSGLVFAALMLVASAVAACASAPSVSGDSTDPSDELRAQSASQEQQSAGLTEEVDAALQVDPAEAAAPTTLEGLVSETCEEAVYENETRIAAGNPHGPLVVNRLLTNAVVAAGKDLGIERTEFLEAFRDGCPPLAGVAEFFLGREPPN